jgi:hypothetical protein
MLELDRPAAICRHVRDVSFTVLSMADDFLPGSGKLVLPSTVPQSFILPPRIAKTTPFVRPVPDSDFSALGNHRLSAAETLTQKMGLSFLALSVNAREFHTKPAGAYCCT